MKPEVIYYSILTPVEIGRRVGIEIKNHHTLSRKVRRVVLTSKVVEYNEETGVFITQNTTYIPIKEK